MLSPARVLSLSPSPPLSLSPSGRYRGAAPSKRPSRWARRVVGCAVQHPRAPASARRLNKEALSTRSRRLYTCTRPHALSSPPTLPLSTLLLPVPAPSAALAVHQHPGPGESAGVRQSESLNSLNSANHHRTPLGHEIIGSAVHQHPAPRGVGWCVARREPKQPKQPKQPNGVNLESRDRHRLLCLALDERACAAARLAARRAERSIR